MNYRAPILLHDGFLIVPISEEMGRETRQTGAKEIEIRIVDPREHSKEQHGKVFYLFQQIADYTGYALEECKDLMKALFCAENGEFPFSMHNVDMSTCARFLTYLVEFIQHHNIPCKPGKVYRFMGELTGNERRYFWHCLYLRQCAICGKNADVHHADAVGMGRDRSAINHEGMSAIALCRTHHDECHKTGQDAFFKKYHLFAIPLDRKLCEKLGLNHERSGKND